MINQTILITARFCAGSSLLRDVFRNVPSVVAFYEPLDEQQPESVARQRRSHPSRELGPTHTHAHSESQELGSGYRRKFSTTGLLLDEDAEYPELYEYFARLTSHAGPDRRVLITCNRIDFRLPWIRRHFPDSILLHIHRNPRDQWLAMTEGLSEDQIQTSETDPFLITTWSRILCDRFPFLADPHIQHPYQRHYHLWKLSLLAGRAQADLSLACERLVQEPEQALHELFKITRIPIPSDLEPLVRSIKPMNAPASRQASPNAAWFDRMEMSCEQTLTDLGLNEHFGQRPLQEIIAGNRTYQALIADPAAVSWARENAESMILACKSRLQAQIEAIDSLIRGGTGRPTPQSLSPQAGPAGPANGGTGPWTSIPEGLHDKVLRRTEELAAARLRIIQEQDIALRRLRQWHPLGSLRHMLAPRIGVLYQHQAKVLELPARYLKRKVLPSWPSLVLITPSYNQARFIESTIKSVLEQEYPHLDYLIQDGGSDDGTRAILEKYSDRVTGWRSASDRGQAHALNRGFRNSSGEIMGWINSDDLLLPGALPCVAAFFLSHPEVDVVYGHRVLIDVNGAEVGRWVLPPHDDQALLWADFIPQETMFWRRRVWEKSGGRIDETYKFALDWELILRFREAGAVFARIPRFLGAFRVHETQKTSHEISSLGFKEMNRLRKKYLGHVPTHTEIRRNLARYLLSHLACHFLYRAGIFRY